MVVVVAADSVGVVEDGDDTTVAESRLSAISSPKDNDDDDNKCFKFALTVCSM